MITDRSRRQPEPVRPRSAGDVVELRDVFRVHRTAQGDAAALQGLTLSVRRGDLLCVLGPSGAGKSTSLRLIAGLEPPTAGVVEVLGKDIGRMSPSARAAWRRDAIGFLDQRVDHNLSPDLPIERGLALPLALRGIDRVRRAVRVAELLEGVSLRERASARPCELSSGERQRVSLCAALAHRPSLLLADEPTGELDAANAQRMRSVIADLARTHGATVVVVSHDGATAGGADRALRLRDGRVTEEGYGDQESLVVDRAGWVRVPPRLLARSGISGRARARAVSAGVVLERAGDHDAPSRAGDPGRRPVGQQSLPSGASCARVEVRSLSKGYGAGNARREVLSGLDARIAPGRLTVVSGRSGSGKSTLLRLIVGLEVADRGDVLLDSCSLRGLDAEALAALRRSRVGYLPQDTGLVSFLGVAENVELALILRGRDPADADERAMAALTRVGMSDRSRQRAARLSAGEAQRVGVARALAAAEGLLVLDEPTSLLDEASTATIAELLAHAAGENLTVICATHEPALIALADAAIEL